MNIICSKLYACLKDTQYNTPQFRPILDFPNSKFFHLQYLPASFLSLDIRRSYSSKRRHLCLLPRMHLSTQTRYAISLPFNSIWQSVCSLSPPREKTSKQNKTKNKRKKRNVEEFMKLKFARDCCCLEIQTTVCCNTKRSAKRVR